MSVRRFLVSIDEIVKRVAIVSRHDEPDAIRLAGHIQSHLESKPSIKEVVLDQDTASGLGTSGILVY